MPFSFRRLSRISLVSLGLIMVATLAALAFGFRSLTRTSTIVVSSAPKVQARGFNSLRFNITWRGIEPAELKITPGRYLVAVDNEVDLKETAISLTKDEIGRVKESKIDPGRRKFKDYVEFVPGVYTLSDPTNPKRVSKITVSPDAGEK